jgi:hypothetical protein
VRFDPTGQTIASGSIDKTIRMLSDHLVRLKLTMDSPLAVNGKL